MHLFYVCNCIVNCFQLAVSASFYRYFHIIAFKFWRDTITFNFLKFVSKSKQKKYFLQALYVRFENKTILDSYLRIKQTLFVIAAFLTFAVDCSRYCVLILIDGDMFRRAILKKEFQLWCFIVYRKSATLSISKLSISLFLCNENFKYFWD